MTLVSTHQIKPFTSPVNTTGSVDANLVRGNDNIMRNAYVAHDADATIHFQSSALIDRPAAGVVGRKWMTVDGTAVRVWYDTGATWLETAAGDVVGPASATDDAIALFDGVTGKLLKDSNIIVSGSTITASLSGNASTATALQTSRTIWGQSFDGTADVTGVLTASTGSTVIGAAALDGSAPVSLIIRNTTNSSAWGTNASFGRLGFWSEDGSSPGNTLRAAIDGFTPSSTGAQGGLRFWTSDTSGLVQALELAHNTGGATFYSTVTAQDDLTVNGGTLTIDTDSNSAITLNRVSGTQVNINWQSGGTGRWLMGRSSTAESGGDTGSDFQLQARTDAGGSIDTPLTITRAAGGAATWERHNIFPAATTSIPSIRLPHGTAPTSPVDGDMWTTTVGLYARINGTTVGPFGTGGGSGPILTIAIHANAAGNVTMTNQASAEQFLANNNRNIRSEDLTNYTEARLVARVVTASASANSPRIRLMYDLVSGGFSTTIGDYTNAAASGEIACSLATAGVIDSGWVALAAGALADVYLAVTQIGGDGAADPALGNVTLYFR